MHTHVFVCWSIWKCLASTANKTVIVKFMLKNATIYCLCCCGWWKTAPSKFSLQTPDGYSTSFIARQFVFTISWWKYFFCFNFLLHQTYHFHWKYNLRFRISFLEVVGLTFIDQKSEWIVYLRKHLRSIVFVNLISTIITSWIISSTTAEPTLTCQKRVNWEMTLGGDSCRAKCFWCLILHICWLIKCPEKYETMFPSFISWW